MSAWFLSSRPAVAEKPFEPSAKETIASRVQVTWSSHSFRIRSWKASCLAVNACAAWACACVGARWADSWVPAEPVSSAASSATTTRIGAGTTRTAFSLGRFIGYLSVGPQQHAGCGGDLGRGGDHAEGIGFSGMGTSTGIPVVREST